MKVKVPLAFKLAATTSLFIAVLLGATIALIGVQTGAAVQEMVNHDDGQIVAARADELGQLLDKYRQQLGTLAEDPRLRSLDPKVIGSMVEAEGSRLGKELAGIFFAGSR